MISLNSDNAIYQTIAMLQKSSEMGADFLEWEPISSDSERHIV